MNNRYGQEEERKEEEESMPQEKACEQEEPEEEETKKEAEEDLGKTCEEELEICRRQLLRLRADFDNYRKRMQKDKEDSIRHALDSYTLDLLQVVDNLERALKSSDSARKDGLKDGVSMVHKQLMSVLEKEGVKEIDCVGLPFDPSLQECVMTVCDPNSPEDRVVEINQKGYTRHGRVIRPAMVVVSRQEE